MKLEDYSKYYIQGSDHYLIPKDDFIELFNEMINWKEESIELSKKYLNAEVEKEQLNTLVNSCQEKIRKLKKQLEVGEEQHNDLVEEKEQLQEQLSSNILQIEVQQKEFIKYMNNTIEDLETEDVDDEEIKGYLIQRIDTFKEILQKYKEIIGVDK